VTFITISINFAVFKNFFFLLLSPFALVNHAREENTILHPNWPIELKMAFLMFHFGKNFLVDFLSKSYLCFKKNSNWFFKYVYIRLPFGLTADSYWISSLFNFAFLFEDLLSNPMLWFITGAFQTRPDGHSDRDGISEQPSWSRQVVPKALYHAPPLWKRVIYK